MLLFFQIKVYMSLFSKKNHKMWLKKKRVTNVINVESCWTWISKVMVLFPHVYPSRWCPTSQQLYLSNDTSIWSLESHFPSAAARSSFPQDSYRALRASLQGSSLMVETSWLIVDFGTSSLERENEFLGPRAKAGKAWAAVGVTGK